MSEAILLINGPHLNLLGAREPQIYGSTTLHDVENDAKKQAALLSIHLEAFQSNHEGAIVDRIHEAREIRLINAGAYTHTSLAIRDALTGVSVPFIEVRITNVHKRKSFRHHSHLSDKAEAVICGLGAYGYTAAIDFACRRMEKTC